ncbi:hypothetical protein OAT67_06715, partial [Bacteriovoracaceae bacterium]|nr:hypothetical protein [Bacteriovoracaceae bacterium]
KIYMVFGQKIKIFIFLIIFSSLSIVSMASQQNWILKRNIDNVKTYKFLNQKNVFGTYQILKQSTQIKQTKLGLKKLIKEISTKKRKTLSYIGISNWKIDRYEFNKTKNQIIMYGSYKDPSQNIINFREEHKYRETNTIQILITWPSSFKISSQITMDLLNQIKKDSN